MAYIVLISALVLLSLGFGVTVHRAWSRGGQPLVRRLLRRATFATVALLLPYYLLFYNDARVTPLRYWMMPWLLTVVLGLLPMTLSISALTLSFAPGPEPPSPRGRGVLAALLLLSLPVLLAVVASPWLGGVWFTVPVEAALACAWAFVGVACGIPMVGRSRSSGSKRPVEQAPGVDAA